MIYVILGFLAYFLIGVIFSIIQKSWLVAFHGFGLVSTASVLFFLF